MVWRSVLAVAAVCALGVSGVAAQQSVDELIARNLEAKGGLEKLQGHSDDQAGERCSTCRAWKAR